MTNGPQNIQFSEFPIPTRHTYHTDVVSSQDAKVRRCFATSTVPLRERATWPRFCQDLALFIQGKFFAKTIFWNSSSPVGINGGLSANQSLWHLTRGEKIVSPHPKTEYVGEGSQLQKLDRTAWGVMLNSHASKTYSSQFIAPPDWRLNHQHIPTANHWV